MCTEERGREKKGASCSLIHTCYNEDEGEDDGAEPRLLLGELHLVDERLLLLELLVIEPLDIVQRLPACVEGE